ncbi:MAG: 16S rRNA (cytosine(1402)-N(4))-methyltransferase RsmH [Gemmatimonadetes bacterium]|nr:16S rRNA (cytosine(1402)-N(4))-methyltransferase RsmH [Gemmatimonadota bacterium]
MISKRGSGFFPSVTSMTYHVPVLAEAVRSLAAGHTRGVDCTAGGGGHSAVLVDAGLEVLAIDRDPEAIAALGARFAAGGVTIRRGRFGDPAVLAEIAAFRPDFAVFDLGVSSHQIDSDDRGFSFRPGVPLDMRMGMDVGETAADLLGGADEAELTRVFREYGDERRGARLAREIVRRRARGPMTTSDDLVKAVRAVLGPRSGPADFARLFQAVRIAINEELVDLGRALPAVRDALVPGGTMAALTYHSGEDRLVKHAFREWAAACVCPPRQPICTCRGRPLGALEPKKPIRPTDAEVARNPRARSARLRAFRTRDAA